MTQQDSLIPMSLGERLRFERERRKRSIAEAAAHLKCGEDVIEALESDRPTRFAAVYHRGYLRNYARWLGIAEAEWRELALPAPSGEPELQPVFAGRANARHGAERWLKATSYVLGSLLVGTLAWQLTHEAVRLSQGEETLERTLASGTAAPETRDAATDGPVNASIASLETLRRTPGPRAGGTQAWAAMGSGAAAGEPLAEGEHRLQLRTSADSWIEIRDARDALLEQDLVRGGSSRSYRGFGPYRITIGRSSAVELMLDGRPVNLEPYTRDQVTQMMLDPDGVTSAAATVDRDAQ